MHWPKVIRYIKCKLCVYLVLADLVKVCMSVWLLIFAGFLWFCNTCWVHWYPVMIWVLFFLQARCPLYYLINSLKQCMIVIDRRYIVEFLYSMIRHWIFIVRSQADIKVNSVYRTKPETTSLNSAIADKPTQHVMLVEMFNPSRRQWPEWAPRWAAVPQTPPAWTTNVVDDAAYCSASTFSSWQMNTNYRQWGVWARRLIDRARNANFTYLRCVWHFCWEWYHLNKQNIWHQKTRIMGLSGGKRILMKRVAGLIQSTCPKNELWTSKRSMYWFCWSVRNECGMSCETVSVGCDWWPWSTDAVVPQSSSSVSTVKSHFTDWLNQLCRTA